MFLNDICKKDGNLVKKMGRALILTNSELELWNGISLCVQEEICKYKFYNYEVVRDELQKVKVRYSFILHYDVEKINYGIDYGKEKV